MKIFQVGVTGNVLQRKKKNICVCACACACACACVCVCARAHLSVCVHERVFMCLNVGHIVLSVLERKKSKLKILKSRLFKKSKKGDEGQAKLSQSTSDITAGKGLDSEEDLT